ncbi:MAG: tRNA1(Val) (adenine(37)-N6)-methyltransferase [Cetobacterium sp.]
MLLEDEDLTLLDEKYQLIQKKKGFRFGTDAVILSNFFKGKKDGKILEIGIGNGIISILLSIKNKIDFIKGIDIQEEAIELARRNIKLNNLENKISLLCGDVKELKEGNTYDYIITNPPYMANDGKVKNEIDSKKISRHEITLTLEELIQSSKKLLKPRGELFLVHRAHRFLEIGAKLEAFDFSIKRVQFVHYDKNKNANLVLIEASKGRKNILEIEPPLILNE